MDAALAGDAVVPTFFKDTYCGVTGFDAPLEFVKVTVTATTSTGLTDTEKGTVSLNSLPKAFDAEL